MIIESKEYRGKRPSDYKKEAFREERKIEERKVEEEREEEPHFERDSPEKSRELEREKEKQAPRINSKPFGSKKSSSITRQTDEEPNSITLMKKTASTIVTLH